MTLPPNKVWLPITFRQHSSTHAKTARFAIGASSQIMRLHLRSSSARWGCGSIVDSSNSLFSLTGTYIASEMDTFYYRLLTYTKYRVRCPSSRIKLSCECQCCCRKSNSSHRSYPRTKRVHQECFTTAGLPIDKHQEWFIV